MFKGDVVMEDTRKLPHDTGDDVQECEGELLSNKVEYKGENVTPDAAVAEDANKSEDRDKNSNEFTNEANDEYTVNNIMEDHVNSMTEDVVPPSAVRSVDEQIDAISENEDQFNTKDNFEDQIGDKSAVEEQNASYDGFKEENSADSGSENGNHVKKVMEEISSKNIFVKTPEEFCMEGIVEKDTRSFAFGNNHRENIVLPSGASNNKAPIIQNGALISHCEDKEMEDVASNVDIKFKNEPKEHVKEIVPTKSVTDGNFEKIEALAKNEAVSFTPSKAGDGSVQDLKASSTPATLHLLAEGDDGTPEDQASFLKELENFYLEKGMDFKQPKFYGQPLNCLKLWSGIIRLGGYDRVTVSKLWKQVGQTFHPPKTCTTLSWTFRIFYEKSLLEYEKHKRQTGELQLPVATLFETSGVDKETNGYQVSESGRVIRDVASRAMQGCQIQRHFSNGETGEPVIKDKDPKSTPKREKKLKSIGSLKHEKTNEVENSIKVARTETYKQLVPSVVDVGTPADWVKISIRQTEDCFEVYALVPGLLREEIRVQSDPAGGLVITGQPEQVDNPWGIIPFQKVITLPERIDPLRTSAVVSLHGRLSVRVPFEY